MSFFKKKDRSEAAGYDVSEEMKNKDSQLYPVSEEMKEILEAVANWKEELDSTKAGVQSSQPDAVEANQFVLLLSGVSSCRKIPGIPGHMGYDGILLCEKEEDKAAIREFLKNMYGIVDQESLIHNMETMYSAGNEYDQFLSFWEGKPSFDEKQLEEEAREVFHNCKSFARLFYPYVGNKGFHAWDYNEQIGICRAACACGLIIPEEFWEITMPLARRAEAVYDSFADFSISCLCGAVYFMFRQNDNKDENLLGFFNINKKLLDHLFSEDGAWRRYGWYHFPTKKWAIQGSDLQPLLNDWNGPDGCLATDKIMVEGCKVGYMYRENAKGSQFPDSGWRFFAGTEMDAYINDPSNTGVYSLNTLCNYDPAILPLLDSPFGSAFFRDENGWFRKEESGAETEDDE